MDIRQDRVARRGFTLVELLVVIAIIGVLIALLLPAVQAAREAGRQAQCKSNIRQFALAAANYAVAQGDALPGYGKYRQVIPDDAGPNPGPGQIKCQPGHSWVVTLLPWIEQNPIAGRWDASRPWNNAANAPLSETPLPLLRCPSDDSVAPGDQNYVINVGVADMTILTVYDAADYLGISPNELQMHAHDNIPIDWNENGEIPGKPPKYHDADDEATTRDTGVAWVHLSGQNHSFKSRQISDGETNTLLFGENNRTGFGSLKKIGGSGPDGPGGDSHGAAATATGENSPLNGAPLSGSGPGVGTTDNPTVRHNWSNPSILQSSFVYPVNPQLTNLTNFRDPPRPAGVSGLPNADQELVEPVPFLASFHPGLVHVTMVGGSVCAIHDDVDRLVYKAMMTPAGEE